MTVNNNHTYKYYGTFESLKTLVSEADFGIVSSAEELNKCEIRTVGGGIIDWWKSTGTIHLKGKKDLIELLEINIFHSFQRKNYK